MALSHSVSTTWKSLAAGFAVGVVSTGAVALGIPYAWLLWLAALGYIVYKALD